MSARTACKPSRFEWMSLMIAFTGHPPICIWSAYPAAQGGVKERIRREIVYENRRPSPLLPFRDGPDFLWRAATVRLTLRTLLAYLDDTLGASEIKSIGEKVAESDAAQELIARIKQVTRRRRLTAPPSTGPGAFEPNDVSEYLDNTLDPEKVADVEKQCLESDVHLAEIAACHQILTLVLGEPALVPPKAKERMYALVKGRESIPYRKAAPTRKSAEARDEELGLSGAWVKFVLPAAAVLLVAALGLAVWSFS